MANNCSIFYDHRTDRIPRFAPPYNLWSFHRPYHLRAPPPDFSLHTEAHRKLPKRGPAQRVQFGSGEARKRADDVFIKKRQPRIHHRANQRSVCAVKARSSRMSARRVLKKLVASDMTLATSWWRRVDSLFCGKARRLRRAPGTPPRAAVSRPHKLRIPRPAVYAGTRSLCCSSSPHKAHYVGPLRGPQ